MIQVQYEIKWNVMLKYDIGDSTLIGEFFHVNKFLRGLYSRIIMNEQETSEEKIEFNENME